MKELIVEVQPRDRAGKNESRRLRGQGMIPGIVYGDGKEPVQIAVDPKKVLEILRSESGANTLFQLSLAGWDARRHVMIREYQVDPVKGSLMHADFVRIQMDAAIEVDVPIRIVGEAAGVKLDGGILEHVTRQVRVSCLPADIPEHIDIDVAPLKINDSVRVSDLPPGVKFKVLTDADQTLVVIAPPAKEEAPVAAAAEAAPAAPVEPEVIKKGKAAAEEKAAVEEGEKKDKDKD